MQYGQKIVQNLYPDIISVLSKVGTSDGSVKLDNFVLQKLVDFVQQGKNADDDDDVQNYLLQFKYSIDFDDLLDNADDWLKDQRKRDFLMQVLLLNNVVIDVNNQEKVISILNKMFETSKYDSEKQQIAELAINKFSLQSSFLNKNIYKFYSNLFGEKSEFCNSSSAKMLIVEKKTNGFFANNENRAKENNSIFYTIIDFLKKKFNNNIDNYLINDIKKLFQVNEDLDADDYIEKIQLKKAKIFLILKAVNSKFFRESDIENSKNIIGEIINLESDEIDNLVTFSENCDFNISLLEKNDFSSEKELTSINYKDIINFIGGLGEVKKKELNNILFSDTEYEDISFVEIPSANAVDDNLFYYKEYDNNKKVLIYFSKSQKERLLSILYDNKNLLKKRKIISNKYNEIRDFIEICSKVNDDSDCKSILDVYNAYYLTEENTCLGSLNNDTGFSTKVNSNNNSVIRDASNVLISTKVLLEWLKTQSRCNNPLREMKVSINDIENLPNMLNEYYNFILDERKKGFINLTPVDNLVIKNAKTFISDDEANGFFKNLHKNWKNCFLSLKIDDAFLAEKAKESKYFKKNQYIIFGSNNNFYSQEAKGKRLLQNKIDLFDAKNKKQTNTTYKIVGDKNDPNFDKLPEFGSKTETETSIKSNIDKSINIISGKNKNNVEGGLNVAMNLNVDLDIDLDLEMIFNLSKLAKDGSHLDKNDLINYDNVNKKISMYIKEDNKRLPQKVKDFLKDISKRLGGNFKSIFNSVANRQSIALAHFKKKNFKGSNFCFTINAFLHVLHDYFRSGTARFNGEYGDPELSIYEIKQNGRQSIYVVAKTMKNILDDEYSHPVKEMIARIPINKIGVDNDTLVESFGDSNDLKKIESNLGVLRKKLEDIDCVDISDFFLNNPIQYSVECEKYISDNKDEILNFLNRISNNNKYKSICNSVCHNFCTYESIGGGAIKKKFSVIDPVKFIRGLSKIFDFLEDLKKSNFIDDSFLGKLNDTLKMVKNRDAIRTIYRMIIEQKINVEKQIILFRNLRNKKKEYIDIDINDAREVNRYFKKNKNSIGNWEHFDDDQNEKEIKFSKMCFNNILSYERMCVNDNSLNMQYGQDTYLINEHSDCGGILDENLFSKDIKITISIDADASFMINFDKNNNNTSGGDQEAINFREYACKLYYFLNKKYKRYQNGRIDDNNLSETKKYFIENKVDILTRLKSYVEDDGISDSKNFKLAYIFVFSVLNCINDDQYYDVCDEIDNYMNTIENLSDEDLDSLYEKISNNKDNAMMFLSSYSLKNVDNDSLKLSANNLNTAFDLIEKNESMYVSETKQQRKRFLAKCWQIFLHNKKNNNTDKFLEDLLNLDDSEGVEDIEIDYFGASFKKYLDGLSCESVMTEICEKIYKVTDLNDRKAEFIRKLPEYILYPDDVFKSILIKIYKNRDRYYNEVIKSEGKIEEDKWVTRKELLKYCFAINNNGDFSLLNNSQKQELKYMTPEEQKNFINKCIQLTDHMLNNTITDDIIELLKLISSSVKHGADFLSVESNELSRHIVPVLLIHSKSKEMMKTNNLKEISEFIQKLETKGVKIFNTEDLRISLREISADFQENLSKFVIFLNSNIISASQREYYIYSNENENIKNNFYTYFDNFTSLLEKLDRYFLKKDKNISFSNERISQILAKAYHSYINEAEKEGSDEKPNIDKRFRQVNEKVEYILNTMERIRAVYSDAVDTGDAKKQTVLINLSGKINFLMDDFSLEDTVDFLKIIENNLTSDLDILNKFDFLKEHYLRSDYNNKDKKKKAYNDITELYNITNNENTFLNTDLSHEEVMMVADLNKKREQKRKSLKLSLSKKSKELYLHLKNMVNKNRGDTSDNNFLLEDFKKETEEIINIALKAEERILTGDKETGMMLLKKIKSHYKLSQDNLFRNENLAFYQSIKQSEDGCTLNLDEKQQTESVKEVVDYVSKVCAIFMDHKELIEETLNKCIEKISNNEKISVEDQLDFIAAYCFKHMEDQGKMLRSHQIALATLRNIFLLKDINNTKKTEGSDSLHLLGLVQTGGGKTITIKLNAFIASLKGKTAFITETNDVLLNQIMADAGKDSFYKGHIFVIDDNNDIFSVSENKVVPADKVLQTLKDHRNLFFATNSRLNFWRRKLWYSHKKEDAQDIATFLREKGHLCIDEVDSLADPKTSNKISITSKGGAKKYYLALALQKCYNIIDKQSLTRGEGEDDEALKRKIKNAFKNLSAEGASKESKSCIRELTSELKRFDRSFDGNYERMSDKLFEVFCEYFLACVTANNLKEGEDFIVEIDSSTGYCSYNPIDKGEPKKNGEKYNEKVDLALRVFLKNNKKYPFKGLMDETQIISNESSFFNYKFFKSSFGVSGSIEGIKEFYKDRYVEGIGSEDISNVSVENNPLTKKCISGYTNRKNRNIILELTFLLFCSRKILKNIKDQDSKIFFTEKAEESAKTILRSLAVNTCGASNENDKRRILDNFVYCLKNEADPTDYTLTYCRDSNELREFANRLETVLLSIKQKCDNNNIKIKLPKIVKLDKSISSIDDFTERKRMEKAGKKNGEELFVFALEDRERGFDFPGSPHLIVTNISNVARNIQETGRTGRNMRPGAITLSYALKDGDDLEQEDFKREPGKSVFNFVKNNDSTRCHNVIENILKENSKSKIKLFREKKDFFFITGVLSEELSIFTNLILDRCGEKSNEVMKYAFGVISEFQNTIEEKFNSYSANISVEEKKANFLQKVEEDKKKVFRKIYDHSFVEENSKQLDFEELVDETDKIFSKTFNAKDITVNKDKKEDEEYIKNNVKLGADNLELLLEKFKKVNEYYKDNIKYEMFCRQKNKNVTREVNIEQLNYSNYERNIFEVFGALNGCGYDMKNYCYKDYNNEENSLSLLQKTRSNDIYDYNCNIIVARKDILSKSGTQLVTKKREVVIIKNQLSKDDMKVLKLKLSTLSPDAMVIFDDPATRELLFFSKSKFNKLLDKANSDRDKFFDLLYKQSNATDDINNCINGLVASDITTKMNDDLDISQHFNCESYLRKTLQIEVCKYYTEHNKMPDLEYLTGNLSKKLNSFYSKIENFAFKGKDEDVIKKAQLIKIAKGLSKYVNGYIKNGFYFAQNEGILSYIEKYNDNNCYYYCIPDDKKRKIPEVMLEQKQVEKLYENYYNELNNINFNIDLTDQEIENIESNKEKISTIFKKKLFFVISEAEEFKKKVERDDNLPLDLKESLLKDLNNVLSEGNIVEATNRFMDIFAVAVSDQNIFTEVDKLIKIFDISNIDDIYNIDSKLSEIERNFQTAEEKLKLREIFNSDEKNTSSTVYKKHNDIINLINNLRSKINKVKKYKNEIDSLDNKADCFEGFDVKGSVEFINEEIDSRKFRYNKMLNEFNDNYSKDFKMKDQISLIENMRDKNISSLVGLIITPENISKVINEFALNNYDSNNTDNLVFFNSESCGEVENRLINGIIDLYKERFGEISDAAGEVNLMEICKERYDKLIESNIDNNNSNDEDNEDDEDDEDKEKRIREKMYKDDIEAFKNDIVGLIKSICNELQDISEDENKHPNAAYDMIKNMMTGLEENYRANAKKHNEIKNKIIETINSVANRFKKVNGIHDEFEKDLRDIIKETLAGEDLSEEEIEKKIKGLMSGTLVKELEPLLKNVSMSTLKKIQESLSVAVGKDMSRTREMVKKLEEDKNFPIIFAVIIAIISFGTIFLTEDGRNMFGKKKISKEKEDLDPEIEPKEYFIRNNSKENKLSYSLKNIDNNSLKNIDVVDETPNKLMPIENKVHDNLSNVQNTGISPTGG